MTSTATVTVLFCDVVGSTERLVRIGDVAGDALRRELFGRLRHSVESAGGTEVKNLGDGLMVVFPRSTVAALVCARSMHRAAAEVDPEDPVQLRIGISVGEVAEEDGDWFGLPVVEAARLCAVAASGQTLAVSHVRTLVGSRAGEYRLRDAGTRVLKGLAAPVSVVEIPWRDDDSEPPATADRAADDAPARPPERRRRWGRRRRDRVQALTLGIVAVVVVALGGAALVATWGGDPDRQLAADDDGGGGEQASADAVTRPHGYEPRLRQVACSTATLATVPDATCSELIVPESRAAPTDGNVSIPVTRRPAEGEATAAPVVLLDVNEPLQSTTLVEHSDVYQLSLRGFSPEIGPDLDCPELRAAWEPTLALEPADPAAIGARVDAAGKCATRLRDEGVQLEGYHMAEVADDVRDLVLAADLGRVTVAAGGFTSIAATAFTRTNPGSVQGLLLTNPVPPGSSPFEDPAAWLEDALGQLVALCEDDDDCAAAHPDLAAKYEEKARELGAAPTTVVASSLLGTGPHTVLLDERRWAAALEAALYPSGRLGLVPQAIEDAGDELLAATAIDEEVKGYVSVSALAGAMLSYTCAYDAAPHATAEISSNAKPAFAGADEPSFEGLCRAWGVPSVYEDLRTPLLGDVPTLLAQGSLSVAGTNDWAGEMADGLDRARVVRFDTLSEDLAFAPPPCLRRLRAEFAQDPAAQLDIEDCEAKSPPVDFVAAG
jgi:class 3 adenylate cyclase/pimeloyl-ACP methyl ester carboxylesterase